MVIILGMVQVAKKIPFEDPNVLNMARAGYILSNVIILAIHLYIMSTINKKKGMLRSGSVPLAPRDSEPYFCASWRHIASWRLSILRSQVEQQTAY